MIKIKLIEEAQIDGCDGAFLRKHDKNGKELGTGWRNYWYTAAATDDKENEYQVYWKIRKNYNEDEDDESEACNWDSPIMVLDKNYHNVIDSVEFDE